ncbi:MAG: lipopolysaccharide transport periplasmic protein LptA [Betaproteobacteria bacterium]
MKVWINAPRRLWAVSLVTMALFPLADAVAEQADRGKQINIEYDLITIDQNKLVYTLEGNVILTQGTMRLAADRIVIREDAAGNKTAQAFGSPGKQIAFKQKREGAADFMEGASDRAEFDDQADTLKLLSNARLKSGDNELKGEYIYYNSATEVMQARNAIPDVKGNAVPSPNGTRPTITIQPKKAEEKSQPSTPVKAN